LSCAARRGKWWHMRLGIGAGKTCQRLWEAIPQEYRQGHCFMDFLKVSASVIAFRAAHGGGQRDRRNCPCGALEEHAPTASGSFCPYDSVVFPRPRSCYVRLFASLSSSLQYRASHPAQVSHYRKMRSLHSNTKPLGETSRDRGAKKSEMIQLSRATTLM
jgi:hypothetical protein